MQKLTKESRGRGRVEFNQNIDFIKEQLNIGANATQIYNELKSKSNNNITIDISVFRRYVRRLKAEMSAEADAAVQHSNTESQPKLQTAPQTTPVLRTLPAAGSASPRKPKDAPLFKATPVDLADEFADDDSAAVATSSESEVAHG